MTEAAFSETAVANPADCALAAAADGAALLCWLIEAALCTMVGRGDGAALMAEAALGWTAGSVKAETGDSGAAVSGV